MTDDTFAGGTGDALDASASITETDPATLDAAAEAEAVAKAHQERVVAADNAVTAAETKVDRQREHLAGAEEALAQAIAEREAI